MADHRTVAAKEKTPIPISRPKTFAGPSGSDWDPLRAQDRHRLGRSTPGNGLWLRHDLLASPERLAKGRRVGQNPPGIAKPIAAGRPNRFFSCGGRLGLSTSSFWGAKTGPNPTDRRKKGSKHHMVTDANGIPLAVRLTGANRHDVTQLLPLVEQIPAIAGKVGRPLRRPASVLGDRAYDSEPHRQKLRQRGIQPVLAQRRTDHGSGLGIYRWVIERTLSWLHQNRRLRIRYERRDDIHDAFLMVGCVKICWNYLAHSSFC
jgi:transposase